MARFAKTFTVRWADCDVNGHMRNTAYSDYGLDVRMAWLAERGFPFERFVASRMGPVILHETLDYLREVRLQDAIEVDLAVRGLSPDGARFEFEHDIWLRGHKKAARVVLAGGWMDLDLRKLRVPPEDLQRILRDAPRAGRFEEMKPLPRRR
jgi:acyl-CoA thioester hydrolase